MPEFAGFARTGESLLRTKARSTHMKRSTRFWVAAAAVGTVIGGGAIAATAAPSATNTPMDKSAARQLAQTDSAKVAKAAGVGSQEQLVVKDAVVTKDGLRHLR